MVHIPFKKKFGVHALACLERPADQIFAGSKNTIGQTARRQVPFVPIPQEQSGQSTVATNAW
jgi:hypothetical protein